MSKLDLEFEALQKARQAKTRLVADPLVGPRELAKAIDAFCVSKSCTELWSLIAPPASAPQKYGFKTQPHLGWLLKALPLLYELVDINPSTKVLSKTLVKALGILVEDKNMTVAKEQKLDDIIDKCDVAIRMLLWWLRAIKGSADLQAKLSRHCNAAEKVKLEMVLRKVMLPSNYIEEEEEGESVAATSLPEPAMLKVELRPGSPQQRNAITASPSIPGNMTLQLAVQIFSSINNTAFESAGSASDLALVAPTAPILASFGLGSQILQQALAFQPPKTSSLPVSSNSKGDKKGAAKMVKASESKKKVFVQHVVATYFV